MDKNNDKLKERMVAEARELLKENPNINQLYIAIALLNCVFNIEKNTKQIADNDFWEKVKAQHKG